MRLQRFSRWFTDWPSTHISAGQSVEVMPVSEHEALRDAARLVVDAEYRRQEWGSDTEATFDRAIQALRESLK